MTLPDKTIERICRIFGYLNVSEKNGIDFVSSRDLARAAGATELTVRKDISLMGLTGYDRKGYDVKAMKKDLGEKLLLSQKRKACIVGLGRLGTALLDYENFQEDGFEIVAGFDSNVNKIERIKTDVDVFSVERISDVVKARSIELGIVTVPAAAAQGVVDQLAASGVKGILNFSPVRVEVPEHIIYLDMDFTNALRFIAAKFAG
ncbi:MAG: redox-sensing transcriptional repressor Rex [Candidatus Omnitrophota bacterium]